MLPDKFHEECGVVALYGHPEASKLAYLSLYALQHRGQESAGIALQSAQLVQLMGGRVWVDSVPGRGSTFHVALPRTPSDGRTGVPA